MDAITQVVALDKKAVELTTKYGLYRGRVFEVTIEVRKKGVFLGALILTPDGAEWAAVDGKQLLEWTELLRQYRSAIRRESKS